MMALAPHVADAKYLGENGLAAIARGQPTATSL